MTTVTVAAAQDHPPFAWNDLSREFYHLVRTTSFSERGKVVDLWCGNMILRPNLATKATRTPIDLAPCPVCRRRWKNARELG